MGAPFWALSGFSDSSGTEGLEDVWWGHFPAAFTSASATPHVQVLGRGLQEGAGLPWKIPFHWELERSPQNHLFG